MRDLIICNKALGNGYAGRWMMHACTDQGSGAVEKLQYLSQTIAIESVPHLLALISVLFQ